MILCPSLFRGGHPCPWNAVSYDSELFLGIMQCLGTFEQCNFFRKDSLLKIYGKYFNLWVFSDLCLTSIRLLCFHVFYNIQVIFNYCLRWFFSHFHPCPINIFTFFHSSQNLLKGRTFYRYRFVQEMHNKPIRSGQKKGMEEDTITFECQTSKRCE